MKTKIALVTLVVFAQLTSLTTQAAIPKNNFGVEYYSPATLPEYQDEELEVARVELPKTTQEDVARWIPLDLKDGSEGRVFGRILGRGLQNVLKETSIGEAARRVQKSVAQDISFGGNEEDSTQARN